jgi:hypothetical protein
MGGRSKLAGGIEGKRSKVTRSKTSTDERKMMTFDGKAVNKQQAKKH